MQLSSQSFDGGTASSIALVSAVSHILAGTEVADADDLQGAALADAAAWRSGAPASIAPSAFDEHPISAARRCPASKAIANERVVSLRLLVLSVSSTAVPPALIQRLQAASIWSSAFRPPVPTGVVQPNLYFLLYLR